MTPFAWIMGPVIQFMANILYYIFVLTALIFLGILFPPGLLIVAILWWRK